MSEAFQSAMKSRLPWGISLSGALSLLAVVSVLVVVSVPRLRGIALQENEVDARGTAGLLASALRGMKDADDTPSLRELLRRPELAGLLADAELVEHGTLLRHHGYLFEVTRLCPSLSLPSAPSSLLSGDRGGLHSMMAIRAWPWAHGATGEAAFLVTAGGAGLVHPNAPPCWEGLRDAGVPVEELTSWRPFL